MPDMTAVNEYAELELSLHQSSEGCHEVELRWSDPQSHVVRAPARGQARIDVEGLLASQLDHDAYGQQLAQQVFAAPEIRTLFREARVAAASSGRMLRVQIVVGTSALTLDELRWELLQDPETGARLTTSERILFSRLVYSSDWRSLSIRSRGNLRSVIAVASPTDLEAYGLEAIDVAGAIDEISGALAETSLTVLGLERPVTLVGLVDAIRDADIVYLMCHGVRGPRGNVALFLQGEDGKVCRADGAALAKRIDDLPAPPSLVILAACASAGRGTEATRPMLARTLTDSGVPAVLVFQGQISMPTARATMTRFLGELLRDGQVDRALAAARGALRERSDHWMPALFLRLRSGRLWAESPWRSVGADPEDFFRVWLGPNNPHNHCWKIIGREALCREMIQTLSEQTYRVHVLEGRGGIGKSKVLHELARRLDSDHRRVSVYLARSLTARDAFSDCPQGPHVLLVDDAPPRDPVEIDLLVELATRHRPALTLVFSCRPHGVEPILAACGDAGLDPKAVLHRRIPNLDVAARIGLAAEALGSAHAQHAETLASCFPDSPLFITVAGRFVDNGSISIDEIRGSGSLRQFVMQRFPYGPTAGAGGLGGEELLQSVVAVAALLLPLATKEVPDAVRAATGDSNATNIVERLLDLGIFADVNDQLRILPDLFGSYTALAWALPRQSSLGRIRKLWRDVDKHWRDHLLRNAVEMMTIASPEERRALRAEFSEIWSACLQALEGGDDSIFFHFIMMAGELPSRAIDLAEQRALAPNEPRVWFWNDLVKHVLQQRDLDDDSVAGRGIDLLVRLSREGRSNDACDVLRELAMDVRWTEAIIGALAEPVRDAQCPKILFECALGIVARNLQARLHGFAGPAQESEMLAAHRRAADFLITATIACPVEQRSAALRVILGTLVVDWGRCGRDHGAAISEIQRWNDRAVAVLEAVDRGLARDGDPAAAYMLRKALREHAWAAVPALAEPMFALLQRYDARLDAVDDVLDVAALPHDIFVARVRKRTEEGLSEDVEAIRTRVILRLLGAAPNLARLRGPEAVEWFTGQIRCVIEDEILTSPARVARFSRTWVEHTIRTMGPDVLVKALAHVWPEAPRGNATEVQYGYAETRLDETYGGLIVGASDATHALCVGHVYAMLDVAQRLRAGLQPAAVLLRDANDAAAVWRVLQERVARLPAQEHPRLMILLHAIVEARPDLLPALAAEVPEECATVDTLAPLLHALYARDPAEARRLAERMLLRGGEPALAVASVLAFWIGGGGECALLRVALRSQDALVLSRAFVAVGSWMACRPEESAEFLLNPSAPDFVPHLDALMRGFLTSHFIRETYLPRRCSHIDEWLGPVGRVFAARSIHPRGAIEFDPSAQYGMSRMLPLLEDGQGPAWARLPVAHVERLLRGMVAGDMLRQDTTFRGEGCLTFVVEYARLRPRQTFSALLTAWRERGNSVAIYAEVIQPAIRQHADLSVHAEILDVFLDAARRERCAGRGRMDMSKVFVAARAQLKPVLRMRLGADGDLSEELLLDMAHLLRTLNHREVFVYAEVLERLHARAEQISPACLHRISTLLPVLDERSMDNEHWRAKPEDLTHELAWMEKILAGVRQRSVRRLLESIRGCVDRARRRAVRAIEA